MRRSGFTLSEAHALWRAARPREGEGVRVGRVRTLHASGDDAGSPPGAGGDVTIEARASVQLAEAAP
jgi:hypothetical protein